jgi:FdhD protein
MQTTSCTVTRVVPFGTEVVDDLVAIEEPLEILAAWNDDAGEPREKVITVTMRTPGDDFDLALGFLLSEGLITSVADVESFRHWASPNRVRLGLKVAPDTSRLGRNFIAASACGVCGKTSIDALSASISPPPTAPVLAPEVITSLPPTLQQAQRAFQQTGGVHGAALVDRTGSLLYVREDVGRHNAVDKVLGACARDARITFTDTALIVSSRASFEIVQKALVAGICTLISIGAPSSMAVDLARRFKMTLIGFVREGGFNQYSGTR